MVFSRSATCSSPYPIAGRSVPIPGYFRKVSAIVPTAYARGSTISAAPCFIAARTPAPYFISPWVRVGPSSTARTRFPRIAAASSTKIGEAASPLTVDGAEQIRGKRVLAVEDGPTLTHGEMKYGAGVLAALRHGAAEVVDPRPYTVGTITKTFEAYPGIGTLLPAMGYGEEQTKDLEATIERTPCDLVLVATPIDLRRVITIRKPALRVGYELQEIGKPDLSDVLARF